MLRRPTTQDKDPARFVPIDLRPLLPFQTGPFSNRTLFSRRKDKGHYVVLAVVACISVYQDPTSIDLGTDYDELAHGPVSH